MTEKEFENLKVGDKVWIATDWFNEKHDYYQAVQLEVKGIEYGDENNGSVVHCEGLSPRRWDCFLKKSEAWEALIKRCKDFIKDKEADIAYEKKAVEHYKAELAKAREEEESGWVIINEHIYKAFPSDCYRGFQKYPTEQEAYEELAEYYTKKAEEAWLKSGAKYYGTYKMVALLNRIKPIKGSQMVHATCVWQRSCYCGKYSTKNTEGEWRVDAGSLFNTEAEAYAKMEKETPQGVRADDCADEISERFKAEAELRRRKKE